MNSAEYKITIGMPVYRVEDYIGATLARVLEQDMDGIEVLVVDDCGGDGSMDVVRRMQHEHPRGAGIRIVEHPENRGAAAARNTIIQQARGRYLFFLDSDDLITPTAMSTLYRAAEQAEAQVVYGSMTVCDGDVERYSVVLPDLTLAGEDALTAYIYSDVRKNLPDSSCNILMRTDFLRRYDIRYPDFRVGEDLMFNEQMQPRVTKAVLLSAVTYYYVRHPGSLMNFQHRDVIDIEEVYQSFRYSALQKDYCSAMRHKPYFGGKCAKTMKAVFYSACGILKHRSQLSGTVSDREIRDTMRHPATLSEILAFKQQRGINLVFWLMGGLPPTLSVWLMTMVGRRKGYIK